MIIPVTAAMAEWSHYNSEYVKYLGDLMITSDASIVGLFNIKVSYVRWFGALFITLGTSIMA